MEEMVDSILNEDDYNNCGFIDYSEFLLAQQNREQQSKQQQSQQNAPH